jgi:hypothetical protein
VERVEHLKDGFLNVILNGNTGAECTTVFVSIKNDCDQLTLIALSERLRNLAHHFDVEDVQRRTSESDSPDAIFYTATDVLVRGCHVCFSHRLHG